MITGKAILKMLNSFGDNLRKSREKCGFTQEELAYKLNLSPSTVGMYEQGRREPDLNTLTKMDDKLFTPITTLLGIEEKFHIKSIQIDKIIIQLIDFIQNQDCVFLKDKKLDVEEINNILYVLKLMLK